MLELGGLLTAGSILLVSILGPIFRRANPPRWTNLPLVPELTTVGITGLLAFGLALLALGAIDLVQHGAGVIHLALLVAIVAGVIVLGRRIAARGVSKTPAPSA